MSIDVNDEWLEAAREELGTTTKVATINAALEAFAIRKRGREFLDALNSVEMDFTGSAEAWRYGGGRDLSKLVEKARESAARDREREAAAREAEADDDADDDADERRSA